MARQKRWGREGFQGIMTLPAAASCSYHEGFVRSGGVRLRVGSYEPGGEVKAEVVITHGLSEHSMRYRHVGERFASRGLRTTVYDLRGHGRSEGTRSDAPSYEALLDDLAAVQATVKEADRPLFLMGHSMGGQITLNYVLERSPKCRGVLAASPWLRLAFQPAPWRIALARAVAWCWPTFTQQTPSNPANLSRDPAHLSSMAELELVRHRISARLFFAVVKGGARALAQAGKFHAPLFLIHGGDDPVTSAAATEEFFQQAGSTDKEIKIYPGTRHETHNDLDREMVLADLAEWMEKRVGEGEKQKSSADYAD